jgi:hypothetical protein
MSKIFWRLLPMLAIAAAQGAESDGSVIRWEWTCGSKAYYAMKVSPDGNYKPVAEANPITLKIRLKKMNKGWSFEDVCPKKYDYVEVETNESLFSTGVSTSCFQTVDSRFVPPKSLDTPAELEEVNATIKPERRTNLTLEIPKDDVEWRFLLSSTSLTTGRRSRELRVSSPRFDFVPEAEVHFITGECF